MNRTDHDRLINAKFTALRIPINGKDVDVKVRALPIMKASEWCPRADEFLKRAQAFVAAPDAEKYRALSELNEDAFGLLEDYDEYFQKHNKALREHVTYEQLLCCVAVLFEVSDPFKQVERRTAEKLQELEGPLQMVDKITTKFPQGIGGFESVKTSPSTPNE